MTTYRKKPVEIEAVRLDLSRREDTAKALAFMGAEPGRFDMPVTAGGACWWRQTFPNGHDRPPVYKLIIATLEGEMEAGDGDWIIRGVKGEFYPCRDDIFALTYEAVDAPPNPSAGPGEGG